LIAAGNGGDSTLEGLVASKLESPSALVRAMAVWALGQLVSSEHLGELEQRFRPAETDAAVMAEWALALGTSDGKEGRPS
jgi:epoxyqueuosine reductase